MKNFKNSIYKIVLIFSLVFLPDFTYSKVFEKENTSQFQLFKRKKKNKTKVKRPRKGLFKRQKECDCPEYKT